ncbi:MAG: fibrobacter succinogenes major paralogous domain-containing protein [Cyclobacteriaceae bacterium]|nr:fibrobacter succinogenes major paralogous domain-containing protein [Cyclobacteriaceae bacterium]
MDGVGIVWGTSPNPDLSDVNSYDGLYNFHPNHDNPFVALLSGLEPETQYYVRAFAGNAHSTTYGEEKTFTTGSFTTQKDSFTDSRDNKQYSTVTISGQTWMAENLAYLPEVCASDVDCGYWVYDYSGTDVSAAKATPNYTTYGVLYKWEMANSSCPAGWHLPTSEEWSILEMNIGMSYNHAYYGGSINDRGTDEGGKLKETGTTHWNSPNEGATNISKFTALPGGARFVDKTFVEIGASCYFWTSSEYAGTTDATRRLLSQNN